ncbi:hypothetical protein PP425_gp294 [Enterobacter phage vB_EclM_Q7622]|uniref:hypothetical protein n=1 Tax=Enterobacter phage vB_EclM_Q7622 TaxID=2908628 RepID=UPI00232995DF|nr:hypothetical protein PP425_gp294 [Enterobacter phage vB_EclM_Q7622]UIS65673.1 hypothetical protein Q76222_00163 [Enterobacter phage vB_EclM_Q7622]
MNVYAIISTWYNCEYGYDEYSLPIEICSSEELANEIKANLKEEYADKCEQLLVVPYNVR